MWPPGSTNADVHSVSNQYRHTMIDDDCPCLCAITATLHLLISAQTSLKSHHAVALRRQPIGAQHVERLQAAPVLRRLAAQRRRVVAARRAQAGEALCQQRLRWRAEGGQPACTVRIQRDNSERDRLGRSVCRVGTPDTPSVWGNHQSFVTGANYSTACCRSGSLQLPGFSRPQNTHQLRRQNVTRALSTAHCSIARAARGVAAARRAAAAPPAAHPTPALPACLFLLSFSAGAGMTTVGQASSRRTVEAVRAARSRRRGMLSRVQTLIVRRRSACAAHT